MDRNKPERSGHYPALYTDPAMLDAFAKGMTGGSRLVAPAMIKEFPWRDYQTIVDIGTAEGCLPVEIARAYPHLGGSRIRPTRPQTAVRQLC